MSSVSRNYHGVRLLLEPGGTEQAACGPGRKALVAQLAETVEQIARTAPRPALDQGGGWRLRTHPERARDRLRSVRILRSPRLTLP